MLIHTPKDLALMVIDQRKKLKLSQSQVGALVGVKQTTISAFENKPENTKLETLFNILSAVNLEINLSGKDKSLTTETPWKEEW
ncbi:MAG: helix-turn-helix domain-containing protein [Gammaproteobacteria bacterium]|jgi:HTH-type transcriptional regulator/antitoxin HipB|nr:helix-turn-helix domain-containing protein [Gammaproteobacteria bacterium]